MTVRGSGPRPLREALLAFAVTLSVSAVGLAVTYVFAERAQTEAVRSELLQLATTTAAQVDGSLHNTIRSPDQEGSPAHLKALEPLVRMHKAARDVIYVYTAILIDGKIHWILDTASVYRVTDFGLPLDPIGAPYPGKDADFRRALTEHVAVVNAKPVREEMRTYMSAYAPFYDATGAFAGVLGVDMVVDQYEARLAPVRRALYASLFAAALLSLATSFGVYRIRRNALAARDRRVRDQEELQRARDDAEQAAIAARSSERAKTAFLAMMGHEIRTPMNGVLGIAELLRGTTLDTGQRRYVETLEASGQALMRILNDLLDISSIESGRVEIVARPFSLTSLVAHTQQLLQALAIDKNLDIHARVAPDVPDRVVGDRERLSQILLNLGSNAVRFTDSGEVRIEAARSGALPHGIEFHVKDSGIGIPESEQHRLFEPFSQISRSEKAGGAGLGLAISQRLAGLMGGSIRMESRPGEGSTFTLSLPLEPAGPAAPLDVAEPASAAARRLIILVAEDNRVNRLVALRMLEKLGHEVVFAVNGLEALSTLEERQVDLVLMDCQMPEMDGLEAARRIRAHPRTAHLPIIAITAGTVAGDEAACKEAGMNGYLSKPLTVDALQRGIADLGLGPRPEAPAA